MFKPHIHFLSIKQIRTAGNTKPTVENQSTWLNKVQNERRYRSYNNIAFFDVLLPAVSWASWALDTVLGATYRKKESKLHGPPS